MQLLNNNDAVLSQLDAILKIVSESKTKAEVMNYVSNFYDSIQRINVTDEPIEEVQNVTDEPIEDDDYSPDYESDLDDYSPDMESLKAEPEIIESEILYVYAQPKSAPPAPRSEKERLLSLIDLYKKIYDDIDVEEEYEEDDIFDPDLYVSSTVFENEIAGLTNSANELKELQRLNDQLIRQELVDYHDYDGEIVAGIRGDSLEMIIDYSLELVNRL